VDSQLEGRYEPLIAFGDLDGYAPTPLRVKDGRLPSSKTEIALGEPLALHKHIGDSVELSLQTIDGVRTEHLTLVGHVVVTVLFPAIDPKNGVIVHPSLATETDTSAQNLVVRIDPAHRDETIAALKKAFPNTYSTAVPPTDVRNLQRISTVPNLLALVIGILAAGSVAHALTLMTRASRHDITMLRVLGATTRQAHASVLWLATTIIAPAVVAGALIGLLGGQISWRAIANGRGLDQAPVTTVATIAVVVVGGILSANLLASVLAWRSTQASPAAVLRAE
jgi:predicted lysophospholipase L1 biosynthesis ABC-type transport system permease subunit